MQRPLNNWMTKLLLAQPVTTTHCRGRPVFGEEITYRLIYCS